ncbi:MAG TPA: c-type cytochrome [Opitutaceae bacterium]|nr:c-type cytochrome [Opitutaceae bacterium]
MKRPHDDPPSHDEPIRKHTFDGIAEFDKKMPNWWLTTFYGGILFAIGYWFYFAHSGIGPKPIAELESELSRIQTVKLSEMSGAVDDATLWKMSQNAAFVRAGETTFVTTCASCHGEKLTGGIGPNLVDTTWIHGGRPTDILNTVTNGVAAKGMPTWGPILGTKKISEIVAFILSKHSPDETAMAEPAPAGTHASTP